MGWFSADEIVAPAMVSSETGHQTAQTVALCAGVAVSYLLVKNLMRCHRQQTEQVAERTARLTSLPA